MIHCHLFSRCQNFSTRPGLLCYTHFYPAKIFLPERMGLGSKSRELGQKMVMQPNGSITIDKKGADLSKSRTASDRPAHAVMFLTLSNHQIIGLFNPIAGNMQTKSLSEGIAGNMLTVFVEITTQTGNAVNRAQNGLVSFSQIYRRLCHIPCPQNTQQLLQDYITLLFSAPYRHTQIFLAAFFQMIPI